MESTVDQEEDLGKPHVLSEIGYNFLKTKIEEMNKKAAKWGVPPMNITIVKEDFVKKKILVNLSTGQKTDWDDPEKIEKEVMVKQYEIIVNGQPPRVEGYEFIAKVEHTSDGNILNYAPNASSKNIPEEYRTARQECDVCKTTRDRTNTFILKLEKDDPQKFSNKKVGDFIMVGSGCLKRFLPNISTNALMEYADMIENLRRSVRESGEMDDDFSGGFGRGGSGNWMESIELGLWLSATYLHTGKYLSKKKAEEFGTQPTLERAFIAMNSITSMGNEDEIHLKIRTDDGFKQKSESLNKEFLDWSKSKDFDTLIAQKPDYADFFHNLKVISKQDVFKSKNSGFFSALFQLFLRDKGELEKINAQKESTADFKYFGQPGEKIKVKVKVKKIKEYESQWGRGLIVTMEAEGQEIDPTTGQPVSKKGNLLYFNSGNFELNEGEEGEIITTVKSHQINKFTQIPETVVTRAKVTNFISNPERNSSKPKIKK